MSDDIPSAELLAYWLKLPPDDVMLELRSDVLGFINIIRRCAELLSQEANARTYNKELEPVSPVMLNDVMNAFMDKTNELQDELDVVAAYIHARKANGHAPTL